MKFLLCTRFSRYFLTEKHYMANSKMLMLHQMMILPLLQIWKCVAAAGILSNSVKEVTTPPAFSLQWSSVLWIVSPILKTLRLSRKPQKSFHSCCTLRTISAEMPPPLFLQKRIGTKDSQPTETVLQRTQTEKLCYHNVLATDIFSQTTEATMDFLV